MSSSTRPARVTVYTSPSSPGDLEAIAGYTLADGAPAVTDVCIFAANYAADTVPFLRANNDDPPTTDPFNPNIQAALDSGAVAALRAKGLRVYLTVMNGHKPVGWSEFGPDQPVEPFVDYLATDVVDAYGLSGIDIDDEYSSGQPNDTSLIRVTTAMRARMPDALLTKALFDDLPYFDASWEGHTLAETLTYGWEMSYWETAQAALPPYVAAGMAASALSKGYSPSQWPSDLDTQVAWLRDQGYGGVMVFDFQSEQGQALAGDLVDAWYGPGNWNPPS